MFADETAVVAPHIQDEILARNFQIAASCIATWAQKWKIQLNIV